MSSNEVNENNSPDVDDRLISFLRSLANSIERKQLEPEQLGHIGEFFMAYKFQEQAEVDRNDDGDNEDGEISHDEFLKFLFFGYYVYKVILRDGSL